ncbi:carboxylesterase/lipase family protein [Arthrobacter sp. zg-Y1110]|uniref:carboxylesterase/lipase family protein n=1 Tax=Arthrobacter sp. zg-Y1110 TaxID=2886932 RepID=UPI001D13EE7F|nr:carboxylesterase family protein [Arthrobacter sp. zg-Y1110]MCC3290909.1 carboxylesterase family protein [Arthrobacter sp. zg-Y1110]UWX86323.1 carboxylesterase family protein [Arthrobacter sp. zg-Y1110]
MITKRVRAWSAAGIAVGLTVTGAAFASSPAVHDPSEGYRDHYPVVSTDKGDVQGEATSMVTSFKGIPYAAPPVGDLRWKAPAAAEPWEGVLDATQFGGSCTQGTGWDPGYDQPTLNEDCLYLNVYRPSEPSSKKLPVFVWNHGGGNVAGAGRDTDPNKFITKSEAVFVTINYRVGAMGWLDTTGLEADNPDGAAGNFGLLDQQAALTWIQENIGRFGGDARNVTLAGQSAGASNTCAQLASPGADGLFDQAILQSGGCSARTPQAARASGAQFAAEIGCADPATELACLRAKSPAEVLAAQTVVRQSGAVHGNAVLPSDPLELLKAGRLTRLPVIVGGTADESQQSVFGAYDYVGNPITEEMLADLIATTYPNDAAQVAAAYPATNYPSPTVAWGDVQSDQRACRDQTLRDRMAADTRTYAYEFAEKDGPAFTSIWRLGTDYPFGATHVNDLGYLWDYLGTALPFSTEQVQLSDQMISYWSSFAGEGRPDADYAPEWPRYRPQGEMLQFVAPSAQVVSHATVDAEHGCELWDRVSPAP